MGRSGCLLCRCVSGEACLQGVIALGDQGQVLDFYSGFSPCSGVVACSGVAGCSGLASVRWHSFSKSLYSMRSVSGGCSGIFCGKLVGKFVRKFVGNMWKKFLCFVEKEVLHMRLLSFGTFPHSGGKVLLWFYTYDYLCWKAVLHIFHRAYYNYYYYIELVLDGLEIKQGFVKDRAGI